MRAKNHSRKKILLYARVGENGPETYWDQSQPGPGVGSSSAGRWAAPQDAKYHCPAVTGQH